METTMVPMVPTMERTMRTMVMEQLHIMQIMELLATILFNTLLFRQAQSSTTLSTGKFLDMILLLNIAKGTTDPRVEFISQVQTQVWIKFHLQNLDQA